MITRRRFLTLATAVCATPALPAPVRWQGHALGAEVTLTLNAPDDLAAEAIRIAKQTLKEGEALFSLYTPSSALSRLNVTGILQNPDHRFLHLMEIADLVHQETEGRFDPTVQPLWQAMAQGRDLRVAQGKIGWHRVDIGPKKIALAQGQALTFNGIAQGVLTDILRDRWRAVGLDNCLINLGEFAALGGPFSLGIADPAGGIVAKHQLQNRAIATSSPAALQLPSGHGHIIANDGQPPQWSTVSVEALDAGIADAASTAFCLMDRHRIQTACATLPGISSVYLVDRNGTVEHIRV